MKKLLALVLALVMTLGLATVGASAAFSDADDISDKYAEAVDVMSGIKVLDGSNGKYNPQGTLTREAGAKIIAYMILGSASNSLSTTTSPFADVAADRWSAGAIAFCTSESIIGGVGKDANGKDLFNPTAELDGYAFAKMALVALGYDPKEEGLVGSTYAINTAKLALSAGLLKNLDDVALGQPLTREQAAQLAFNTEKATMVQYTGGMTVTGGDTTVSVGKTRSAVAQGTFANYCVPGVANLQFCERYTPTLKLTTGTDDFGRDTDQWKYGATTVSESANETPVVTYTSNMNATAALQAQVASDLNGYGFTATNTEVWLNGLQVDDDASDYSALDQTMSAAKIAAVTATGRQTEVYADSANEIVKVVLIDTYVARVIAKDTVNKTVTLRVNSGASNIHDVEVTSKANDANKDFYDELYALDKGSYTLINLKAQYSHDGGPTVLDNNGGLYDSFTLLDVLGAPKTANGKITKIANGTYTIGGSDYLTNVTVNTTLSFALGDSRDLYLDQYGNVAYYTAASTSTSYAFVLAQTTTGDPMNGQKFYAQLLLTDGNVQWVEVTSLNNSTTFTKSDFDAAFDPAGVYASNMRCAFVSYVAGDDGYALSVEANEDHTNTRTADNDYQRNETSYVGYSVSNDTVFLLYDGTSKTWTSYKGLSTMPAKINVTEGYVLHDGTVSTGFAKIVVAKTLTSSVTDRIYVYSTAPTSTNSVSGAGVNNKTLTLKAIVNGVITTVDVKSDEAAMATGGNAGVQNLFDTIVYTNDYISGAAAATYTTTHNVNATGANTYTGKSVAYKVTTNEGANMQIKLSGGVLTITKNDSTDATNCAKFLTKDDTNFYLVDKNGDTNGTVSSVEYGSTATALAGGNSDVIHVVTDANGAVEYVIVETP